MKLAGQISSSGAAVMARRRRMEVDRCIPTEKPVINTAATWASSSSAISAAAASTTRIADTTMHMKDDDCTVDADGQCAVCGVSHTATCPECGGRGFHKANCVDNDERTDVTE